MIFFLPASVSAVTRGSSNEYIVGYDTVDETHTITGEFSLYGDLYIKQNTTLVIENANVEIIGNVYVLENASLIVRNSAFALMNGQDFHRMIYVIDNGLVRFEKATLSTNGYSSQMFVHNNGRAEIIDSLANRDSYCWLIAYFVGNANLHLESSEFPNEIIPDDTAQVFVNNANVNSMSLAIWLNFHYAQKATLTGLKAPTERSTVAIEPTDPQIEGIDYSIQTQDAYIHWLVNPGFFTEINLIDSSVSFALFLSGYDGKDFVNVAPGYFADYQLPLYDFERVVILKNTDVLNWQLYLAGKGNQYAETFRVIDSRLNEFIVFDKAFVRAKNSTFGPAVLGTLYDGNLSISDSNIQSIRTVAFNESTITLEACNLEGGPVIASDKSTIYLKNVQLLPNTQNDFIPQATMPSIHTFGEGKIFMASLDPITEPYSLGGLVPISGTADIQVGPASTVHFDYYQFEYSVKDSGIWQLIDSNFSSPVRGGHLGDWDTSLLSSAGSYYLRLTVFDTDGNSVEAFSELTIADPIPVL